MKLDHLVVVKLYLVFHGMMLLLQRCKMTLGLRKFLEDAGHTLVVTSDKDGDGCEADKELVDADIVISQPFFPYYLTRDKMKTAPNLKMAITAGIGSDHVDRRNYATSTQRDSILPSNANPSNNEEDRIVSRLCRVAP